ncbi:MAG: hypothetical protein LBU39_02935 [Desulfobulbaceae bacterium]|jgi:uncharacterized membrane protein YciS (DUF1049 family)|nr:hypothetical protein [Desulfobulbaceae bacterium]
MDETGLLATLVGSPFVRGLALGLILCVVMVVRAFFRRRELVREIDRLRKHLHTKLEIDAAETERRKAELTQLKQERDNLRITVQSLNQKPGRKEIRQFYIYQTALDIMFEKAPGFAPAWQVTLKEAEQRFEKSESGVVPMLKRLMPGSADRGAHDYEGISRLSMSDSSK